MERLKFLFLYFLFKLYISKTFSFLKDSLRPASRTLIKRIFFKSKDNLCYIKIICNKKKKIMINLKKFSDFLLSISNLIYI